MQIPTKKPEGTNKERSRDRFSRHRTAVPAGNEEIERSRTLEHLGDGTNKERSRDRFSRHRTAVPAGNEDIRGERSSYTGSRFSRHSYRPRVADDDDDGYHTI